MVVEESQLHEFHMDFAFLGGEDYPGVSVPTLVVRKRSTKMVMAAAFPSKSTGSCVARRVVAFMQEVGCEQLDFVVKSQTKSPRFWLLWRRSAESGPRAVGAGVSSSVAPWAAVPATAS